MSTETNIANTATATADHTAANTIETNDATDAIPEIPMRVLKVGTASSLSGRSTLGYAIGCDESNVIHLSLRSNTASGMYSKGWLGFTEIANALVHADKITSTSLLPLYANTSRNNAGFMLAVLLAEGLVCPLDRHYMRQDFKPFEQHVNALIAVGVDLGDADTALAAIEALQANADVAEADVLEADGPEEDAPLVMPAAKRGRPAKRA